MSQCFGVCTINGRSCHQCTIAGDTCIAVHVTILFIGGFIHSSDIIERDGCFGCQPFGISGVFPLIQDVAKRLENVVIENQDFETLIRHYDRPDAFFYCDPPYFDSEYVYDAPFSWEDHQRLNRALGQAQGKWLLSYNDCREIRELYRGYALLDFRRSHTMARRFDPGREFRELLIGNYDLYERDRDRPAQLSMGELWEGPKPAGVSQILKERTLPWEQTK